MSVAVATILTLIVMTPSSAGPLLTLPSSGTHRWVDWPAVGQVLRLPVIPHPNWRPGHRGIDLRVAAATEILAPATGTIAWIGTINQVSSISILDKHGYKHSLLPVTSTLTVGDEVQRGDVIGEVAESQHCIEACLHWSMRKGRVYVDPRWFAPPLVYRLPSSVRF